MELQDDKPTQAHEVLAATALSGHPHLALDPRWLAAAIESLPGPDRVMVARVASGADLDAAARALGVTRSRFDVLWAKLLGSLVRRGRDEGALRRGRFDERELSLARLAATHLREYGWQARVRNASVAATSPEHLRLAVEAVGKGKWALEAAIGEARSRSAGTPGVRSGLALASSDVPDLRSLAASEPRAVPEDLAMFVVEGAHVRETTLEVLAAPPAPMPRGPFAGHG